MWEGTVFSIHIAPTASEPTQTVNEARAVMTKGIEGDGISMAGVLDLPMRALAVT
jgi:hypothetical protein